MTRPSAPAIGEPAGAGAAGAREGGPSAPRWDSSVGARACGAVRILLLEDEDSLRFALAETLRDDGHTVHAYARPSEVTPAAIDGADIVITDYRMGLCELDGLALADAVHARHANAPVVLLTAHDSSGLELRVAARDGFVYLRQKPIDYPVLHALVHQLVPGPARA